MRSGWFIFLLVLGTLPLSSFALKTQLDSLSELVLQVKEDTTRIKLMADLSNQLSFEGQFEEALDTIAKYLALSRSINYQNGEGLLLNEQAGIYTKLSKTAQALETYKAALKVFEDMNDVRGISSVCNNLGVLYGDQSDYPQALAYYLKGLKYAMQIGNARTIAYCKVNIGTIYYQQNDWDQARLYFENAVKDFQELGEMKGLGHAYYCLAGVASAVQLYDEALENHRKALDLKKANNDVRGMAASANAMGDLYLQLSALPFDSLPPAIQQQYSRQNYSAILLDSALLFQQGMLATTQQLGDHFFMTYALRSIGHVYQKKKNWPLAIYYYQRGMALSDSIDARIEMRESVMGLAEVYRLTGQYDSAYHYLKMGFDLNQSIFNEDKNKELGRMEGKFETEKEMLLKDAEYQRTLTMVEAEKQQQQIIIWSVVAGLVLVIGSSISLYQRFQVTRAQKRMIEKQKREVDIKNKHITDSINYARTIQEALLPGKAVGEELFGKGVAGANHFVLFQPKDIVSGDFYWMHRTTDDKVIWAAADCTGHGVPGAFMSMIGNSLLNEIIIEKGITRADLVLNHLREDIKKAMGHSDMLEGRQDGMDIALCVWNKDTQRLQFAGAYNGLYRIRKGELTEIKGDRQPIGSYIKERDFTLQELDLQQGDCLYVCSDGFRDQFGGPANTKFTAKRFRNLLTSLYQAPMSEQKQVLYETFQEWKGETEQLDDVCVIGVLVDLG